MKKTIALLLGMAFMLPLNSCFKEEEDLFPESAAQRLNRLGKEYKEALCQAEDGWVMQYFANEAEQGYPILMKFEANGSVKMAANNAVSSEGAYKEESSTFSMLQDMSTVISFDTYNTLLHTFAQPTQSDGVGHGGDYEFQIQRISASKDTVYMVGKKHGLPIRLIKFPKGATYTDKDGAQQTVDSWQSYFTALDALKARLFHPSLPAYKYVFGDESFDVDGLSQGVMRFVPSGLTEDEAFTRTYICSIIFNIDGSFRLSTPFTGEKDAFAIERFYPAAEGDCFVETGNGSKLLPPGLSALMLSKNLEWQVDGSKSDAGALSNISGKLKSLYEAAEAGAAAKDRTLTCALTFDSLSEKYVIKVSLIKTGTSSTGIANYYATFSLSDGQSMSIQATGEGDRNASAYGKQIAGLTDLVVGFSGDYTATIASPLCPTSIKFVSKADANDWFVVNLL